MNKELVPDLAICQEAKAKGVVIESSFWWISDRTTKPKIVGFNEEIWEWQSDSEVAPEGPPNVEYLWEEYKNKELGDDIDICPAPLTDEILKVLPETINRYDRLFCLRITKTAKNYYAWYEEFETDDGIDYSLYFEDKKLSNALLLLAIKLKDEGII